MKLVSYSGGIKLELSNTLFFLLFCYTRSSFWRSKQVQKQQKLFRFLLTALLLVLFVPEMEITLQEERSLKLQAEGKLLQLEKDHSMLDCDYKQAQHKLDELQAQKERLSEEVRLEQSTENSL